ncbi:nitrate- and nitrite sensing domain-containing protein [Streptomyces sp. CB01881]|uniref:sensor histidine kinase n=1 Tax=Streptomyces sp. CB01881 TaxID=2078691 RepID=UPI001F11A803|nr:nitrate- and nitrite sensing domain-containing protein [Streptomyces sp. CB01881]
MRESRGTAPGTRRGSHAGPPVRPAREADRRSPRPGQRGLRALRPRTVRARIVALLMVPVVSVLALWGFASVTAAQDVWDLMRLREAQRTVLTPVGATVAGLQAERAAAGQVLAAPGATRESALREAAAATDRALAPLFFDTRPGGGRAPGGQGPGGQGDKGQGDNGQGYNRADALGLGPEATARLDALGAAVGALPELRSRVPARGVGWPEAYAAYGAAVDRALAVACALTPMQDHRVASDARVLLEFARSRELLSREDALLRTAQLAGGLTEEQLREFSGAAFARRQFEQGSAADLRPGDRAALLAVTGGQDHRDLVSYEDRVRAAADGRAAVAAVPSDRWSVTVGNVARDLRAVEETAGRAASEREDPYALGLFTPAGLAVLLGLVGVVASLVISVQIGRGLVTELIGLRNSALELAGRKLPATIRRLRAGEEVDIDAEVSAPVYGGDEIGQVHGALGTVQRAAVTAAVERAEVLSGVSGVFVNLARRSQVLVHRQLTLLDAMERRTEDPAELADLFRLDHLTTRMRRHAEGLIILSGAAPGRAWRKPVPLLDVVRAAVSEVEEYARVEVHRLSHVAVTGQAVADLTHLVAELVENATGFSPPHTRVRIRGEQVGNGYALEIEDRGLGMGPEVLAESNRRIAAAEQTDLFDSDRLGLFVVSRLARRHGVRVSLQTSAYGGTTAVVLLPTALLAGDGPRRRRERPAAVPELDVEPAVGGPTGRPAGGPRHTGHAFPAGEADGPEAVQPHAFAKHEGRPEPASAGPGPASAGPGPGPVFVRPGSTPVDGLPGTGPSSEGGALLPFGARGADPGVLRPVPFRASGARADGPPAAPAARPGAGTAGPAGLTGPAGPAEPDELPRRVRQTSLVPQLREAPPQPRPGRRRPAGACAAGRDPEAARAAMAAFQAGWARGKGPDDRGGELPERRWPDGRPGRRPDGTPPPPHHPLPPHHPEGERP